MPDTKSPTQTTTAPPPPFVGGSNTNSPTTAPAITPTPTIPMPQQDAAPPPPPGATMQVEETKKPEGGDKAAETKKASKMVTTSSSGSSKKFFNKKIATALGLLLLIGGVAAGVMLIRQPQDIRKKAAFIRSPQCVSPKGIQMASTSTGAGDPSDLGYRPVDFPNVPGTNVYTIGEQVNFSPRVKHVSGQEVSDTYWFAAMRVVESPIGQPPADNSTEQTLAQTHTGSGDVQVTAYDGLHTSFTIPAGGDTRLTGGWTPTVCGYYQIDTMIEDFGGASGNSCPATPTAVVAAGFIKVVGCEDCNISSQLTVSCVDEDPLGFSINVNWEYVGFNWNKAKVTATSTDGTVTMVKETVECKDDNGNPTLCPFTGVKIAKRDYPNFDETKDYDISVKFFWDGQQVCAGSAGPAVCTEKPPELTQCNQRCEKDSECTTGYCHSIGDTSLCRNKSCSEELDCTCQTAGVAQCQEIRAYKVDGKTSDVGSWTQLSSFALSALESGDVVYFTVRGSENDPDGNFDKGEFTINEGSPVTSTSIKPPAAADPLSVTEYYTKYTIPGGVNDFTINARIHHKTLGWF